MVLSRIRTDAIDPVNNFQTRFKTRRAQLPDHLPNPDRDCGICGTSISQAARYVGIGRSTAYRGLQNHNP